MRPLRERRERRALHAWDRRCTLVFDERTADTHRLTCLEHDLTDAERLGELGEIADAVVASSIRTLVLDLRRVHEADSKLVGLLLQIARRTRGRGVRLRVFLSESVERWLRVCRVDGALGLHSDTPDGARLAS